MLARPEFKKFKKNRLALSQSFPLGFEKKPKYRERSDSIFDDISLKGPAYSQNEDFYLTQHLQNNSTSLGGLKQHNDSLLCLKHMKDSQVDKAYSKLQIRHDYNVRTVSDEEFGQI